MRSELIQALILLVGLQVAGPLLDPITIGPSQVVQHLGEHVTLEGRIAAIEPGDTVTRVELADANGTTLVLTRTEPPPMGATARINGDATAGREGPLVWADGPWHVLETPDPSPVSLAQLANQAPNRAGTTVAVVATWEPDTSALIDSHARLSARLLTPAPDPGLEVTAWGLLEYEAATAAYRLDVTGWRPWSPST